MTSELPRGKPRATTTVSQTLGSRTLRNPPEELIMRKRRNKSIGRSMIWGILRHGRWKQFRKITKDRRKATSDMAELYGGTLSRFSCKVPVSWTGETGIWATGDTG